MFKYFTSILCAFALMFANIAHATTAVVLAGTYNVASTNFTAVPGMSLTQYKASTSFNGGGLSMRICMAVITVKDAELANLTVRATFNGAIGTLGETATNSDGSKSFGFTIVNPPNQAGVPSEKCKVIAQVKKNSGADILLDTTTGDIFNLEG